MMLLMQRRKVDHIIRAAPVLMLLGVLLFGVGCMISFGPETGVPTVFTSFTLCSLGLYGWVLRKYETEPELWMLAGLILAGFGTMWLYFEIGQLLKWGHMIAEGKPLPFLKNLPYFSDSAISIWLMGKSVRFTVTTAVINWRETKPDKTANKRS